ncbi:MAG: NifU family protein, partial [Nitrospinaceae bacterium]|nr:NifU family protein [Nitrospinaceae bacterium]NIR54659.1 NifU family protein [Nitrospinaceae bacterium]NIS85076.1 NifU family protein [Nitrospinaceae bacterium]NIT81893.1 NifU family protein [Nitrospinaceae bacterium]NIU44157.1 NifU family protein [Nitrospinaceae bacterium]
EALFSFGDVENIYLHENFVSVTLDCPESWELMGDAVKKTIEEHLTFYDTPDAEETGEKVSILEELKKIDYSQLSDPEKVAVVDALLEETVRPSLAQDGGGLEVIEARDNIVRIRYQGACGSCPSSVTGTLRAIENILSKSLEMEIRVFPN